MILLPVLGMGFLVLITAIVLLGMQHSLGTWLTPLLDRLSHPQGSFLARVALKTAFLALSAVQGIVSWLAHIISHAVSGQAAKVGQYFHGLARVTDDAVVAAEAFANATARTFTYLRNTAIPTLINAQVAPVRTIANTAKAEADAISSTLTTVRLNLQGMLRGLPWGAPASIAGAFGAFFSAFSHLWNYVYGQVTTRLNSLYNVRVPALERRVTTVWDDLYTTGRDSLRGIRARLTTIEGTLGADFAEVWRKLRALLTPAGASAWLLGTLAALLGLTIAAVRVGLGALFCRNTQGVARKLCAMDELMIAELLAGTLTFAMLLDPKAVAKAGQEIAGAMDFVFNEMADL